jgi:hypothetical protein
MAEQVATMGTCCSAFATSGAARLSHCRIKGQNDGAAVNHLDAFFGSTDPHGAWTVVVTLPMTSAVGSAPLKKLRMISRNRARRLIRSFKFWLSVLFP